MNTIAAMRETHISAERSFCANGVTLWAPKATSAMNGISGTLVPIAKIAGNVTPPKELSASGIIVPKNKTKSVGHAAKEKVTPNCA